MKFSEHFDPKTREYFQAFELGDFEYKKPMEYYKYALTLMMMFLHNRPKITAEKYSEEYFYRVINKFLIELIIPFLYLFIRACKFLFCLFYLLALRLWSRI